MTRAIQKLSRTSLAELAEALHSNRLNPPYSPSLVKQHVPESLHAEVAAELQELDQAGMQPSHIAVIARMLSDEKAAAQSVADRVELVWSGMDVLGSVTRDTRVVIRELFRSAKKSVLISSFVVDDNEKARSLFGPLAERMNDNSVLSVRLFVNIQRNYHDDQTEVSVLLRQFADRFRDKVWPGGRLPEVYYDPRSLAVVWDTRASLHAKCVVVDKERTLVTSANFTQAAQERNIEAGVLIADQSVARALVMQFGSLVDNGVLMRVPGL